MEDVSMKTQDLAFLDAGTTIDTDLVIIGGGAAGLTIAREFLGTSINVLILESGRLEEDSRITDLNLVESIGEPKSAAQVRKRTEYHGMQCPSWSSETQKYGLRCRVLGGSTHAWAGKSAAFDHIDFAVRDWVPYSGWPFGRETLEPYLDRAAEVLNLGPNCYDDRLWKLAGIAPPQPPLDPNLLRSFFWQFARSRLDGRDAMRFGPEFLALDAPNVDVLLNATVTRINTNEAGSKFESLEVSTSDGARSRVRAKAAVLAASGVENARLLLVSNGIHPNGLGNGNDIVGRFLLDHPSARIGRFEAEGCAAVAGRFGAYRVRHHGRTHRYIQGFVPAKEIQERERLMHCAAFMMEEPASDDPWGPLTRLLRAKSTTLFSDLLSVASNPGLLAKGACMRMVEALAGPEPVMAFVDNAILRKFSNFSVRQFQSRDLPHKLKGITLHGITEQCPDPESRITLSDKCDPLGMPIARVNWRVDDEARRSLIRLGHLIRAELARAGLPAPVLDEWVANVRLQDGVIIDMGHTAGTTRMSDNPKLGVVNSNCQVHGVAGMYIAGASVFPTSGHVNPTLMILSLAIRLADQIKSDLARPAFAVQRVRKDPETLPAHPSLVAQV
jgi:choline dehydrogenase-like flavoprotein